jgi:hypothetical protein
MQIIEDSVSATVDCSYSNIGEEWCAALIGEDGKTLAYGKAQTRADALRNLAMAIDAQF